MRTHTQRAKANVVPHDTHRTKDISHDTRGKADADTDTRTQADIDAEASLRARATRRRQQRAYSEHVRVRNACRQQHEAENATKYEYKPWHEPVKQQQTHDEEYVDIADGHVVEASILPAQTHRRRQSTHLMTQHDFITSVHPTITSPSHTHTQHDDTVYDVNHNPIALITKPHPPIDTSTPTTHVAASPRYPRSGHIRHAAQASITSSTTSITRRGSVPLSPHRFAHATVTSRTRATSTIITTSPRAQRIHERTKQVQEQTQAQAQAASHVEESGSDEERKRRRRRRGRR